MHELDACPELVPTLPVRFVGLSELYRESDIITLHVPLTPSTRQLIDRSAVSQMKRGAIIVNTDGLRSIDTPALVAGLESGQLGGARASTSTKRKTVICFRDVSAKVLQDDALARLLSFPNVIVTAHQGF